MGEVALSLDQGLIPTRELQSALKSFTVLTGIGLGIPLIPILTELTQSIGNVLSRLSALPYNPIGISLGLVFRGLPSVLITG